MQHLPLLDFLDLTAAIQDPNVKRYTITPQKVALVQVGNDEETRRRAGKKIDVVYGEPKQVRMPDGSMGEDPGRISLGWANEERNRLVGEIAKQSIGVKCLALQLNENHTESRPNGYRRLIWLVSLESKGNAPANAARPVEQQRAPQTPAPTPPPNVDAHTGEVEPMPTREVTPERMTEHLGEPYTAEQQRYIDEEPF